jgi:hypothetical protein
MNDNEMMKLKSTKFFSSSRAHLFLFFVPDGAWVVWELLSPPLELSPPPEWTGWGGGYGYARGGGYEYGWEAGPLDEPPTRGGYEYGAYPYGGGGNMDTVEEHYHLMNHWPEVESMNREASGMEEDMTIEVEVVERVWGRDVGEALDRQWSGEASASSSGVGWPCKIGVFKMSHHVCKLGLQMFAMA